MIRDVSEPETSTIKPKKKKLTATQIANILDKGGRIFELVKSGASWRSISSVLQKEAKEKGENTRGYSFENCRQIYRKYVDLLIEDQQQAVEEHRVLLLARLDDIYLNYSPYARAKVDDLTSSNAVKMKMKAGDILVKAIREQAEILGVKKPQKVEVFGADGAPLIPRDITLTIDKIYGSDGPDEIPFTEPDGGDGEGEWDAEEPA